jgi:hypothetical protein
MSLSSLRKMTELCRSGQSTTYENGRRSGTAGRSVTKVSDQTETGFSSCDPGDLQKVVVSVVVWPFFVAVSSIGRQVLPSARLVAGATGLALTTVGGAVGAGDEAVLVGSTV